MRLAATSLALFAFLGCAGSHGVPPPIGLGPGAQGQNTIAQGADDKGACIPPTTAPVDPDRTRGLDALFAGKPKEAAALFEAVRKKRPRDLGAEVLLLTAQAALRDANFRARDAASATTPIRVAKFPLAHTFSSAPAIAKTDPIKLAIASSKPNLITDDADWFEKNGLKHVTLRPGAAEIPEFVASTIQGRRLDRLFLHEDHAVGIYGDVAGVFAPGKAPLVFDLTDTLVTEGGIPMAVDFGQMVGSTLIVAASHNGYAKQVNGKHGFVLAIDREGKVEWASQPLVANASSFVVVGSHLISGYGFTAEPDALFSIDLISGETEQKLALASGPSDILRKGDQLFVRTYDTDVVVRLPQGAPLPPLAVLSEASARARPVPAAEERCWTDRALEALDARDERQLADTVRRMEAEHIDDNLVSALKATAAFLAKVRTTGIDLTTVEVIRAEDPPWEYALRTSAPTTKESTPQIVKLQSSAADPVRMLKNIGSVQRSGIIVIPPADAGRIPEGGPQGIPSSYGGEDLREIIPSGDRQILIYGGRYVAVLQGQNTERIFDFEAYRHPPKADPQWKEFAVEDVTFAQVSNGALIVANGGGSYAREVFGKKGFMSAIDYTTGKLLWRSDALVNDSTFVLLGDLIVTGYGFTDEADFLFVLSRTTGRVLAKSRLDTGPDTIELVGDRVVVEAYANHYEFSIKP